MFDVWLQITDFATDIPSYVDSRHAWLSAAVLMAFTAINTVRILAYVPQIVKAARDRNGATAISYMTWGLFALSHLTTIAYALVCLGNALMALIFLGNVAACLAIVLVTAGKRRAHRQRTALVSPAIANEPATTRF